jgi:hypothetical protein
MTRESSSRADTLPCRHASLDVDSVKDLLVHLAERHPEALSEAGLDPASWDSLLRAAVESLRGTFAASTGEKRRFVEAVLNFGLQKRAFVNWGFVGTGNRNDYRVELPDGTVVCLEQKGCPDGNNTNIWTRPGWAQEFIVWCLCPEGLIKQPGEGTWSGVGTRLLQKEFAENQLVDAMIFWDGRCGSDQRRCPKRYGAMGLRSRATAIPSQLGTEDWVPPPCIYLFPRAVPDARTNPEPPLHTVESCRFARALLTLFGVPDDQQSSYVHDASARVRTAIDGTQLRVRVTSRCWADGDDRELRGNWKAVRGA